MKTSQPAAPKRQTDKIDPVVRIAAGVAGVETLALLAYTIIVAISAFNSTGAQGSSTAPVVEVIIFMLFTAGAGLIARSMWRNSTMARPPFFLLQMFAFVTAYTLWKGDTGAVKTTGLIVGIFALSGFVLGAAAIMRAPQPVEEVDLREKSKPKAPQGARQGQPSKHAKKKKR